MAVKKGGLGRGLDSLFADTGSVLDSPDGSDVTTLPLHEIQPDRDQPRKTFEEGPLREPAKSIESHGIIQPLIVRPIPTGGYRIVAGERRWRAARLANLREVPVVIRELSDLQAMEMALVENLQREDLDPIEEALGYRQLMDRCSLTQEQAAEKVARSRSAVANSLRLLSLPDSIVEKLQAGELTTGHAKAILSLPSADMQAQAADAICAEKMNVRQAEALCKKLQKKPKAPKAAAARPSLAAEVEISLREALGTEVHVRYQDGQGTLSVGFYSDEQLRAFAKALGEQSVGK